MSDPIKQLFEKEALLAFSLFTDVQLRALMRCGDKLNEISSDWYSGICKDFNEYYDLFWLWTLGAYEVLRTMDQHKQCFGEETAAATNQMKKDVAKLRMPFAKQELAGKKDKPIRGENSGVAITSRGITFSVEGNEYASNIFVRKVLDHLESIKLENIKSAIPKGTHDWP